MAGGWTNNIIVLNLRAVKNYRTTLARSNAFLHIVFRLRRAAVHRPHPPLAIHPVPYHIVRVHQHTVRRPLRRVSVVAHIDVPARHHRLAMSIAKNE
jgi:hypothetical protein